MQREVKPGADARSKGEVQPDDVVEILEERTREAAGESSDSLHGYRPDLFGLGLRHLRQSAGSGG